MSTMTSMTNTSQLYLNVNCTMVTEDSPVSSLVRAGVERVQEKEQKIKQRQLAAALKEHKLHCKELAANKTKTMRESKKLCTDTGGGFWKTC